MQTTMTRFQLYKAENSIKESETEHIRSKNKKIYFDEPAN